MLAHVKHFTKSPASHIKILEQVQLFTKEGEKKNY